MNIASHLPRMAALLPEHPAVIVTAGRDRADRPIYARLSFAEMEALSNRYANGLTRVGVSRGMRVLVMVRPGVEFIGLIFALFKMGAPPVLIDPGMGVPRLLECIRQVDAQALLGVPLAQAVRVLRRGAFASVKHFVTVGRRWFWGGPTLDDLARHASAHFDPIQPRDGETAAILFTSGSTGPAKGVVYEHGMFNAQVRMIQSHYSIQPGEVDLPTFPLFALFSTGMGMTAVIPDMNPSRPADVNPARIVEAIRDHGVTTTFGSPALWGRVSAHCVERGVRLPTLKRVLIAGAPVPAAVLERLRRVLSAEADVYTPYGATESLPVSSIGGREILGETRELTERGAGTCVGRPLPDVDVRIIRITDDPIPAWSDDLVLPAGRIGEIAVRGAAVTKEYFALPAATAAAKIRDGATVWHRVGDVGYLDEAGRLWFCGRKAHRVVTRDGILFTECCEPVFHRHPGAFRCALVGVRPVGAQTPVLIVEPNEGQVPGRGKRGQMVRELLALGAEVETTRSIRHILFHRKLPVDVRHNAKINREALAAWAENRIL